MDRDAVDSELLERHLRMAKRDYKEEERTGGREAPREGNDWRLKSQEKAGATAVRVPMSEEGTRPRGKPTRRVFHSLGHISLSIHVKKDAQQEFF